MSQTPREIVSRTLKFENPERVPRHMWTLPWIMQKFPEKLAEIQGRFPDDIIDAPNVYKASDRAKGDIFSQGTAIDAWGCIFENIEEGIHGEVKKPLINNITDFEQCKPPYETLPDDYDQARKTVNEFCDKTNRFVIAKCLPRPWERYQWIRGTENAMMDVITKDKGVIELIKIIHDFYMKELKFWVSTDVDAIFFMDDWGSQRQLLIPPAIWKDLFKPLYKDYCDLAHANDKFAFMHSDGCITEIYQDLVKIGVDAINSQLFTMDMELLSKTVKGKITFWGEIDRQHVLPSHNPQQVKGAVRNVIKHLYDPKGGIIAQFELGPGSNPDNAVVIFEEWEKLTH